MAGLFDHVNRLGQSWAQLFGACIAQMTLVGVEEAPSRDGRRVLADQIARPDPQQDIA
jgi:hypothetical protein